MFGDVVSHEIRSSRAEQRRLVASGVSSRRATRARRKALESLVAYTSGLPDAGCRCSVCTTRWQGSWVLTERAVTRFRFSRALAGITRAGRDRVRLLDSDLAIIPCSARAGNMSSLFTSELRSATLSPRAGSITSPPLPTGASTNLVPAGREHQNGNCRNGSGSHMRRVCPELYAGDGLSWRRVTYAPGPSHKPSKIARFPRKPAPAPRVGRK